MATQEAKRKAGDGPGGPSDSNGVDTKRQRLDGAAGEQFCSIHPLQTMEKGTMGRCWLPFGVLPLAGCRPQVDAAAGKAADKWN
jgi:hypothetical protein